MSYILFSGLIMINLIILSLVILYRLTNYLDFSLKMGTFKEIIFIFCIAVNL